MTLDKFGSHILSKYGRGTASGEVKTINIADIKLYYHITLPFLGQYFATEKNFVLTQDGRTSYRYPFNSGTIISGEFPQEEVILLINGKTGVTEGREIKMGDLIAFRRKPTSSNPSFYGELIVKCPIIIET